MKKSCLILLILTLFSVGLFSQKFREMKFNSQGEDVSNIQELLSELGYGPITVNGIYDKDTVSAVQEFKKDFSFLKNGYSDIFTEDDYKVLIDDSDFMLGYKECIKEINKNRKEKTKKSPKKPYSDNSFSSQTASIYTESINGKKIKCVIEDVHTDESTIFMSWTVYPVAEDVFVYQFYIDCDYITAWISYYCVNGTMYEINMGDFIEEVDYYATVKNLLNDMYKMTQN